MIRKTLLVMSLVLLVVTVGSWARSYWVSDVLAWVGQNWALSSSPDRGIIFIHVQWAAGGLPAFDWQRGFSHSAENPTTRAGLLHFGWLWAWGPRSGRCLLAFPTWLPAIICSILPCYVYLWVPLSHRHHRGQRLCLICGYNLTGNVSGVCPECGTEAETPDRRLASDLGNAHRESTGGDDHGRSEDQ